MERHNREFSSRREGRDLTSFLAAATVFAVLGLYVTAVAIDDVPASANRLLISHAWDSPSEMAALKAVVNKFMTKYPDAVVSMSPAQRDPENLLPTLRTLVGQGHAPEACYAHDGYGAQGFVDAALLRPTDKIWASEKLDKVVPPTLRAACQIDGSYYLVPIGVHRVNLIWYNKPLLTKHRIDPNQLATWDELFAAAETLRKRGIKSPIQMAESWTLTVAFQSIVASLGLDLYERWVNGEITAPDDPKMLEALQLFGRYLGYVNADHAGLAWNKALQRVVDGEAAFFLMGDWSNGEFRLFGEVYGTDYGAILAPGTKGMYGMVMDGFVLPKGVASTVNAERWLRVVASREGQDAFNVLKGSIPPRSDVDDALYDAYQKSAIAELKRARATFPGFDEAVPDTVRVKVVEALTQFATDRDARKASAAMAQAASTLAKDYKRVWEF